MPERNQVHKHLFDSIYRIYCLDKNITEAILLCSMQELVLPYKILYHWMPSYLQDNFLPESAHSVHFPRMFLILCHFYKKNDSQEVLLLFCCSSFGMFWNTFLLQLRFDAFLLTFWKLLMMLDLFLRVFIQSLLSPSSILCPFNYINCFNILNNFTWLSYDVMSYCC